jgi:hypothetical protein
VNGGVAIAGGPDVRKNSLLILLAFALAAPLHAGEWGSRGISRRFLVSGDRLYAADGRGVSVYDVANASSPRRIDEETGDDETRDLALMGGTLVVATQRGIDRFTVAADGTLTRGESFRELRDITRIAANDHWVAAATGNDVTVLNDEFVAVRHFKFGNAVRALAFAGDVLYAGVADTAIFAVDPETGDELAVLPIEAADFARSGSTLWVAGSHGLFSIDVTDPTAPRALGNNTTMMKLTSVAASGTRVYAVELPDLLHVYDATSPAAPRLTSRVHDWVHTIAASGTRVFLSGTRVDVDGSFETGLPLRAYDAANLESLRLAGDFNDLAGPVNGAWTDGSIAYIVDPPYLRVLDVSKTAAPRELTSIVVPDIGDHIRVRDNLAIIYGRAHVSFIDVANPLAPKILGSWYTQGHPPSAAAFLRDTIVEANEHSGLHIVDYSDPARAVQIAGRIWHYHDVVAGDDAVYVMELNSFLALDITDRRHVVDRQVRNVAGYAQLDTIPPNSGAPQYLAWRGLDSIVLLTLEDRFQPREIATIPLTHPDLFGTSATSVYVTLDGALSRIDVSDPSQIVETGLHVTAPQQISVAGDKLVIADRYSVRVYGPDTPPPALPQPIVKRRSAGH